MPRTWAVVKRQPAPEEAEEPVTVLVTGFGPFLEKFPKNSSWEIASRLPSILPASPTHPTPIHVHVHHEPIRVAYQSVLDQVPKLLPPGSAMQPAPAIILHMGLAAGRTFYTLEKGAHGRGYGALSDVDGAKFPDEAAEERFPAALYPPVLSTSFDDEDVLRRWKANLGFSGPDADAVRECKPDVRLSPDAGNFMCGFIYYNSLAHYFSRKQDERPVAFLHVPDLSGSQEELDTGREVAIALIKALVESRRHLGVVDRLTVDAVDNEAVKVQAGTDVNFTQNQSAM